MWNCGYSELCNAQHVFLKYKGKFFSQGILFLFLQHSNITGVFIENF